MTFVRYFLCWLRWIDAHRRARTYGREFCAFANKHFDRNIYLASNPDVARAGWDAFTHWIFHGLREERIFANDVSTKLVSPQINKDPRFVYLNFGKELLEIRERERLPATVLDQLKAQGEHDPILFGPGARALSNLPINTIGKLHIDFKRLAACLDTRPKAIFVIPLLVVGGAEKYAADIYQVLKRRGVDPIIVLVTDQHEKDAAGWKNLSIIKPFRNAQIVFWRDVCSEHADPGHLASLLVYMEPEILVVTYSGICLQAIARYGKRLSQKSKIFCTFFSLDIRGLGVPYGITFARQTTPYATSITDNEATAVVLNRRFETLGGPAAVIPPRIQIVSRSIFNRRLSERLPKITGNGHHWVWVSRLDKAKGVDVLALLAMLRPRDTFDLYGSRFSSLDNLGLNLPNVRYQGVLNDVLAADFSGYQGFLFTSPLEGMPNIVLEMSQHAIPLIISDAGGLRETFDDQSAIIISVGQSAAANAKAFDQACDRLNLMPLAAKNKMVIEAYKAVSARHSAAHFQIKVCQVFGV